MQQAGAAAALASADAFRLGPAVRTLRRGPNVGTTVHGVQDLPPSAAINGAPLSRVPRPVALDAPVDRWERSGRREAGG